MSFCGGKKILGFGGKNQHVTPCPGIKPGSQWWEVGALTTVPSLLPKVQQVKGLLYQFENSTYLSSLNEGEQCFQLKVINTCNYY